MHCIRRIYPMGEELFMRSNSRDLAPRNVLVTKRRHDADPDDPETEEPVLIDFGQGLRDEGEDGNRDAILEDAQAYAELINQLAIQWMEETNHETIPLRLVDILRRCKSEDLTNRANMRQVVQM